MTDVQILVLALVQGLTEFLPVSSSAHLILIPKLLGWTDQGLAFDIALHLGTLVAVLLYFRQDLLRIVRAALTVRLGQAMNPEAKIGWSMVLATIPVGLAGLSLKPFIETTLRAPWVIAYATIGFGLLLGAADFWGAKRRTATDFRWRDALWIGLWQALALIPGASRSGVTLSAGLLLGLTPQTAARFSFLLSIPVIALAAALSLIQWFKVGGLLQGPDLLLGAGIAALSGYACIHYFLKLIARVGLWPFVLYRLCLGLALLYGVV